MYLCFRFWTVAKFLSKGAPKSMLPQPLLLRRDTLQRGRSQPMTLSVSPVCSSCMLCLSHFVSLSASRYYLVSHSYRPSLSVWSCPENSTENSCVMNIRKSRSSAQLQALSPSGSIFEVILQRKCTLSHGKDQKTLQPLPHHL